MVLIVRLVDNISKPTTCQGNPLLYNIPPLLDIPVRNLFTLLNTVVHKIVGDLVGLEGPSVGGTIQLQLHLEAFVILVLLNQVQSELANLQVMLLIERTVETLVNVEHVVPDKV